MFEINQQLRALLSDLVVPGEGATVQLIAEDGGEFTAACIRTQDDWICADVEVGIEVSDMGTFVVNIDGRVHGRGRVRVYAGWGYELDVRDVADVELLQLVARYVGRLLPHEPALQSVYDRLVEVSHRMVEECAVAD